ncbi:MAG: hypothetical protein ACRDTG_10360 [Pseudonocardiaceae bacterium]
MKWTEEDFFRALTDKDDQVAQAARALYEHTRTVVPGGWVYWGQGAHPAMTAQVPIGTKTLQPWSFYLTATPDAGPGWAVNFEWIHKGGQGTDAPAVEQFASQLSKLPGLASYIDAARAAGCWTSSDRKVAARPQHRIQFRVDQVGRDRSLGGQRCHEVLGLS